MNIYVHISVISIHSLHPASTYSFHQWEDPNLCKCKYCWGESFLHQNKKEMEANLVPNDDEYHQNERIQGKQILLNALYILSSSFSFVVEMISEGRSALMAPNAQLHVYLYI